ASVHGCADQDDPGAGPLGGTNQGPRRDQRRDAESDQPAVRLSVPDPLPARAGQVRRARTAVAALRRGPLRRLSLPAAAPDRARLKRSFGGVVPAGARVVLVVDVEGFGSEQAATVVPQLDVEVVAA